MSMFADDILLFLSKTNEQFQRIFCKWVCFA